MSESRPIVRVPVILDKQRTMLIDWNAMFLIEEAMTRRRGNGEWVSIQSFGDLSKLSIADMRTMIWGSLVHEDESLTEKDVGKMIHPGNSDYVCEKLTEAFLAGDKEDSPEGKPSNGTDPLAGATG